MNSNLYTSNFNSLKNRNVILTGATGGLGKELCRRLLKSSANLYMVNRNEEKTLNLINQLKIEFPTATVEYLLCDLNDLEQLKKVVQELKKVPIDILMLNAGAYALPKSLSFAGYNNVFQANFLSQYYLVRSLLKELEERNSKVVVTGSIAHSFNHIDEKDPDFQNHRGANNIYGNSKRFLMFATMELLKNTSIDFAIGHPGISLTGITNNYPPFLLKIVKPGMRLLFMPAKKACLSIFRATCETVPYCSWVGPKFFGIWGKAKISPLHSCSAEEREKIFKLAEEMYHGL